jgi:hypothetical protein
MAERETGSCAEINNSDARNRGWKKMHEVQHSVKKKSETICVGQVTQYIRTGVGPSTADGGIMGSKSRRLGLVQ